MSRTIRALQANKRGKLVKGVPVRTMSSSTRIAHRGEITCRTDTMRKFGQIISTVENLMVVRNFTMDEIKAAIADGSWSVCDD